MAGSRPAAVSRRRFITSTVGAAGMICMQTTDLSADIAAFRRAGVEVPFLIQDKTPREERVPRQTTHANRVTGIGAVTVAVSDLPGVRSWYAGALKQPVQDIERADLDGAGARFVIGPHVFEFVTPNRSTGPLADWLQARGPSPCGATLTTASGRTGPLDEKKALARVALV